MNESISTGTQGNEDTRYSNKDQSKGFALFGYIALAVGVIAAIVLVVLFGIPGYFYG